MIKFVYSTDLHGNISKYEALFRYAKDNGIGLIHIGADILPKGSGILKEQKAFCKKFLKEFYSRCTDAGIKLLMSFGNDDLYTRKKYVREYATLLDEAPAQWEGYTFLAYSYVPDYCFGLKSACKIDFEGWVHEPYISAPVEATENGFEPIVDVEAYFKAKGTIEQDLQKIHADRKTIAAIHTPPKGYMLDVVRRGSIDRYVGSTAVAEWIRTEQPLLVLSGHIHESPEYTGIWKEVVGDKTLVIQPGQYDYSHQYVYVVAIEIDGEDIKAERISLPTN